MRYLFLFTLCFIGFNAYATSEQYTLRTEFTFCKYNDGKGQDDVVEFEKKYEKFLRKNGLKYSKAILTPILAGETDYDFVLWGTWPNGQEMYKEYGAFINDYKSNKDC